MSFLRYLIATGFFSGYSPFAPGTVGSLIVLLVAYYFPMTPLQLLAVAFLLFLLGVWASSFVAHDKDIKDPSIIVVDEMVGMLIALAASPHSFLAFGIAFLLFRLFDIWKPFPIKWFEKVPDGWGVMLDDVIAGIYAFVIMKVLIWVHLL